MHRLDFQDATLVAATGLGFLWLYVASALLKLPAWPPAVAMIPYLTRTLMALRADMEVIWEGALGLLCGILISWIGLEVWAIHFSGDPLAMALVMLTTAAAVIGLSRLALFHEFHSIVVVKTFLGAVICYGLFSSFWATRLMPERLLFGWLDFLILSGKAQPYLAGVLAALSVVIGGTLSYAHHKLTFWLARAGAPDA